jgi:hypothetical protein
MRRRGGRSKRRREKGQGWRGGRRNQIWEI